jgi:hypothetical protein
MGRIQGYEDAYSSEWRGLGRVPSGYELDGESLGLHCRVKLNPNLQWLHYLTKRLLYATPTLVKPRSKALSRVISRRDPSRSPIRRRTTRTTAALATPMPTVNVDQGAELEAWEKLRCFEAACKAGLTEVASEKQAGVAGKGKAVRGKTQARGGARASGTVRSVKDATLWFVANE